MASFVRLTPDHRSIAADIRVVKAADYQDWLTAQECVEVAQREAEQIRDEARQAFDVEKRRGYQKGLDEAAAESTMKMIEVTAATIAYFEKVEQDMVELVIESTRKIIGSFDDNERAARVVHQTLSVMRSQRNVSVRVHPDFAENVREQVNGIIADYPDVSFIEVKADPRVPADGCIVESDIGTAEASIATQLEALANAFRQNFERVGGG